MSFSQALVFYSALHSIASFSSESVYQQRTAVSLVNTMWLSSLAAYPVYLMIMRPNNAINEVLAIPAMTNLADALITYFATDLTIGAIFDRKKMSLLEGYIHHIAYILAITYVKYKGESSLILLYLPFEIPTCFLNLNRLDTNRPYNLSFGISFVVFRILYNMWLINIMASYNSLYTSLTVLMLLVHSYWFSKWCNKYIYAVPRINNV